LSEAALTLRQRFKLSRFFSGEAPVPGPIRLGHRRIFIVPSLRGLGFVLLIGLLLLIAFVYNNNLAYLLSFLLAGIFFVTILHSFQSLAGLEVQAGYSQPVFAGEAAGFTFHVGNPGQQPRFELNIALQNTQAFSLAAGETQSITLSMPAQRRGWQACGTVTVSSSYPLGLFRVWSPLRFDNKVLVYPKPVLISAPFPETDAVPGQKGQSRRNGDEFYGLKSYQSGDNIRRIHWKAFAKGQGLQSKQYSGSGSMELWLDYDAAAGHHVEERISQLCRWVMDAEQAGLRYGLILPGIRLQPDAGSDHYLKCLRVLALF